MTATREMLGRVFFLSCFVHSFFFYLYYCVFVFVYSFFIFFIVSHLSPFPYLLPLSLLPFFYSLVHPSLLPFFSFLLSLSILLLFPYALRPPLRRLSRSFHLHNWRVRRFRLSLKTKIYSQARHLLVIRMAPTASRNFFFSRNDCTRR